MSIQPLEGQLAPTSLPRFGGLADGAGAIAQEFAPGNIAGDAISQIAPPWLTGAMSNPAQTAMFGPLAGLLQQLMQMLQCLMGGGSYAGNCPQSGDAPQYGNEQYFQNATGASQGDPHLSFNGTKWNNMASHPNLLNSDSIPGGFQISTQVGSPNAKGVTRNQSATIALDNGQTTISMNADGQASISEYGRNVAISAGQTLQLSNGSSITCNRNGSLTVDSCNGSGGRIETTLTAKGQGVDVDVNAHDVDLGGYLVRASQNQWAQPGPIPGGALQPGPEPVSPPVANPFSQLEPSAYDFTQTLNPYGFAGL